MSINKQIKGINNKIQRNKAQYDLDRETVKISALPTGNVSKYEFLTGKDVLPEKNLLEKAFQSNNFDIFRQTQNLKSQLVLQKNSIRKVFEPNKKK